MKGNIDDNNHFECHVCERSRKMENVSVRLMSKENTIDPDPESTKKTWLCQVGFTG